MHFYKNYPAMSFASAVDLSRDLDQIGIVSENYCTMSSRVRQLCFVAYPVLSFVIDGNRLDSPAAQPFGNTHVDVLIGVDF